MALVLRIRLPLKAIVLDDASTFPKLRGGHRLRSPRNVQLWLLAALLVLACGGPTEPRGPNSLGSGPPGGTLSSGLYRIPYSDGSLVQVWRDHDDHTPPDRIDMAGTAAGFAIVASASGTIRAIVDRHGSSPGAGDGLSADRSQPNNDALEHSCQNSNAVVGSCSDYNNYVWIEHANGEWTKYSHFGTGTVTERGWEVGDHVEVGQVLGIEGDVGFASGRHLHYEVGLPHDGDASMPLSPLGGFMVPTFGANLVPRVCDIPNLLYETGRQHVASPCSGAMP